MSNPKKKTPQKGPKKASGKSTIKDILKQSVQPPARAITPPQSKSNKK